MTTYLITGVTGGLGASVLQHLYIYTRAHSPTSHIITTSSKPNPPPLLSSYPGVTFRHADYNSPSSLPTAFAGVDKLLFVSTDSFNDALRFQQHGAVVAAAKAARVGHVYYTSLAFGNDGDSSVSALSVAHMETERMLRESGLHFTSIREAIYAEAFPVFLDWWPDTRRVALPADGPITLAARDELGEGTARLMVTGKYDSRELVLLSGPEAVTWGEVARVIAESTGREIEFEVVGTERHVREKVADDPAGKGEAFFRMRATWFEDMRLGNTGKVSGLLEEMLGRRPEGGLETVRRVLRETDGRFEWHQNLKKAA